MNNAVVANERKLLRTQWSGSVSVRHSYGKNGTTFEILGGKDLILSFYKIHEKSPNSF